MRVSPSAAVAQGGVIAGAARSGLDAVGKDAEDQKGLVFPADDLQRQPAGDGDGLPSETGPGARNHFYRGQLVDRQVFRPRPRFANRRAGIDFTDQEKLARLLLRSGAMKITSQADALPVQSPDALGQVGQVKRRAI